MTANSCAGFESRTYPLDAIRPVVQQLLLAGGTTTNGAPGNDDARRRSACTTPTPAHHVAYDFATGYADISTVAANSGTTVVMNDLHRRALLRMSRLTTTNNVRDQFASQAYNLNTGSVNWATSWIETGDDDPPRGQHLIGNLSCSSVDTNTDYLCGRLRSSASHTT